MSNDFEMLKSMSAIYRCAFFHQSIHKNTMRNQLILRGKVSTKNKFYKAFDKLVETGGIIKDKEMVSINPKIVKLGFLKEEGENEFYVVMPSTNNRYRISKSVASSYKSGDPLHVVIEKIGGYDEAIVLGKNYGEDFDTYNKRKIKESNEKYEKENLALGRVVKLSHDELVFIPNKKSFPVRQIPILNSKEECALFQDKICVMKLEDINVPLFGGYIVEVKGDAGNPVHEYDAIAESYGAIMSWEGEKLEKEIANIPSSVDVDKLNLISEAEAKHNQRGNVVDLRHLDFTTVDPATCKDMDDAIYSTINQNGDIVCYTAVANVSKYFPLDSEIGKRYIEGCFTIYAPNKAYNILPSKLSTGICSLNPNEDRLAFVVRTVIDKDTGLVKKRKIYDALIQSKKKYSYEEAQEIVDRVSEKCPYDYLREKCAGGGGRLSQEEQVVMNYYAGQKIKQGFDARKMLRFVSNSEREVKFDEDLQNIVDIIPTAHLYYHEVIEAFMITANEATAKFANDNSLDNIYRVHAEPDPYKVDRANEFFDILGIEFEGDLSAEGTRELLEIVRDSANEEVINNFLIKMQSRAVYSDHLYSQDEDDALIDFEGERISHYALQSPHYSHTTSPIRRVPDYVTQFNILAKLHGTKPLSAKTIEKIVTIANKRQLSVDQAEKDFEDINSVIYCEQHIGEHMRGRITKIRNASVEEGYEDDIIVIVKEEKRGINAEIPLSQILGRRAQDCELSPQRCAVYDNKGNILLTLCKPIDFIVEKADRKSMRVVGKTNKQLVAQAGRRENVGRQGYSKEQINIPGKRHQREKHTRAKRWNAKKNHAGRYDPEEDFYSK
ncbi:MAG: RNB domain-containing ribonuclease [Clostridia bacterium]|nr:RNB domain-containing ribonuclease [Clostridia bacterium]